MVSNARHGPLAGLRVIELAHVVAGPVGGLLLADMGADVVKVEKVPGGDDTRRVVPPEINGESATFMIVNRNKRGVAVDLKAAAGRDVMMRMIEHADVVLENYRPGTMEKLGLAFDALQARNPALVYCKISGFGMTGPYSQRPGYDLITQGMSGLMSLTGEGPDRPPVKVGVPVGDVTAGVLAATGILAAYIERLRTGHGQYVDTSLLEASIIHTYLPAAALFATGEIAGPMGSVHHISAPYQAFPTSDGWLNIGAMSERLWIATCHALGVEALATDPRFVTNASRMANRDAMVGAISAVTRTRKTDDWVTIFDNAGVAAGPVRNIKQVLDDPQTHAREMVIHVDHPSAGELEAVGLPIKFSHGNGVTRRAAPLYGQHTAEVMQEIGYTAAEIERLSASGAVHLHSRSTKQLALES